MHKIEKRIQMSVSTFHKFDEERSGVCAILQEPFTGNNIDWQDGEHLQLHFRILLRLQACHQNVTDCLQVWANCRTWKTACYSVSLLQYIILEGK
jgi:hypothetical protein